MTANRDNLAALELLREARAIAALHEDRAWVLAIESAIRCHLLELADGNHLVADTVIEWMPEYSLDDEFPWLEKIQRAITVIDDKRPL